MAEQAERVGRRLAEARAGLGLTRSQMAERFEESSVTDDYIYRWETGRVMPSESYQGAIIEHYELDGLADLMSGPASERKERGDTPDLGATMDVVSQNNRSQLDRIERQVADNKETLAGLVEVVSQLHLVLEKLELEGDTQQQTDATGRKRRRK